MDKQSAIRRLEPPMGSRDKAVFKAYWHEVIDIEPDAIFLDPIYLYKTETDMFTMDVIR